MTSGAQVDGRSDKEKSIDDWLPITSSRNAKWWYSAFHNVTAMVGAGVLSQPYAMSHLGWNYLRDISVRLKGRITFKEQSQIKDTQQF